MKDQVKKKRILIVCQHFWPESFRINDIADFLQNEKDYEVEVLCGLPNYPSGKITSGYSLFGKRRDSYKGVKIERVLEVPRGNNSSVRIFLNYVSFPFFSLFHIPRLLTRKYDKIFLYQLSPVMMSVAGIIIGKIKKIETIMYVLDLWPENLYSVLNIKNSFLRKIAQSVSTWHYKRVDKIIALSERMRKRLVEVTKKPSSSIIVLPQACEKIYEQEKADASLSKRFKDTFNIVYAGNISPAQSFDTIIDAAQLTINSGIKNIRWVIVGDGMSKNEVMQKVKEKSLSDYFIFEGQKPIEDIPKYTSIANAFIGCLVKSDLLEATIPAKVMSYIASGRPLLLGMDGEVQELVNSTIKCGFVSNAGDSTDLYNNIVKLYSLPKNEQDEMGKRSKEYHFKHFERNLTLRKLSNFMFKDLKL